jgi:hypothetical protein
VNGVKLGETSAREGGGNPELSLAPFAVAVSGRKGVAVGTKQAQVLQPVVFVVPIDVVKLEWNRLAEPLGVAAQCTPMLEDTFSQQSVAQFVGLYRKGVVEVLLKRLLERQTPPPVPPLPSKVRCVEAEVVDSFS